MKSILITGASSGIGAALALKYANLGYQVYAGGRNQERLAKLQVQNNKIIPLVADLTNLENVKHSAEQLPLLELLILNAGDCEYIDDAANFDGALFARVINNNLISLGYCLEAYLPKVKAYGQLALTSSSAGFLPLPRAEAYGASKAAVTYLAKTLAIDLRASQISVSVIHPGFVKTPLTDKNNFAMPGLITVETAADAIIKGLQKRRFAINFPFSFIIFIKLLALLPFALWRSFASRYMVRAKETIE